MLQCLISPIHAPMFSKIYTYTSLFNKSDTYPFILQLHPILSILDPRWLPSSPTCQALWEEVAILLRLSNQGKSSLTGCLIKEAKMSPSVKSLFDSRTKSFFESDITSLGALSSIVEAPHKYELFHYFEN